MDGGHPLVLILTALLMFVLVIVTFGNSDYHEQARRKLATDIPGFISIDCGATGDYYDNDTGIFYKTDTEFTDTGTNMNLPPASITSTDYIQQVKNLRSFSQGTKNCYTLKPEQGKNNNHMVRAFFYYGNYDGKNQPPVFDLYLGANKWDVVNTSQVTWKEINHFSLTDNIYVCLVNTGFGIPFISALELRLLDSSVYRIESGGLQLLRRIDVGGSINLRYKNDTYDRIWNRLPLPDAQKFLGWDLVSTQSTIDTHSSNDAYYPPEQVLRTAAQTQNSSTSLTFSWGPCDNTLEYYVYFYFTEILDLQNGQLRELNISFNGEFHLAEPIRLEYLKPLTMGPLILPIKDGRLTFSILATKESNLPPILNAFEIFVVIGLPETPTDTEDVDAIMDIKHVYGVTRNWQGDPCVPIIYSWDGLDCSFNNPPRIISLNLASSRLTGKIASSLSNLTSIVSLDLSNNDLTGLVPEFLAQLPSLKTLTLTRNKLSGSIPLALREKDKNGSLRLSAEENPNLCLSDSCKSEKKFVVPLVASIGEALVLFLISTLVFWYCKSKKQREYNREGSLKSKNQEFTYSEIVSITDNCKTDIGEGGFGIVYLGILKNGNKVAVKLRSPSSQQGPKEFLSEVQLLMRVHHRNLVSLIGYCNDDTHMALVYEYMAHGNLRQHLSETKANVLNWKKRLQISIDAAQGLEYLHNGCRPPVIHRDMKTSNILLDENWKAKISDFGLSRDVKNEADTHISTDAAGTPAYIDPEYQITGKLSKKSDVYSFGIVLLELITGQPAVIKGPQYTHILKWVSPIIERGDIQNIVDQRLQGDFSTNSAWKAVEIAMSCIPSLAIQRPDMSEVVTELKECLVIEMAVEKPQRMVSSEPRPYNSHEMATVDLEFEMAPYAR